MRSVFERKKLAFAISIAMANAPMLVADDIVPKADSDDNSKSQEVSEETSVDVAEGLDEQSSEVSGGKRAAGNISGLSLPTAIAVGVVGGAILGSLGGGDSSEPTPTPTPTPIPP